MTSRVIVMQSRYMSINVGEARKSVRPRGRALLVRGSVFGDCQARLGHIKECLLCQPNCLALMTHGAPGTNLVEHLVESHEISVQWTKPRVGTQEVIDLYRNSGLSAREVAHRLGISKTTVLGHLQKFGT